MTVPARFAANVAWLFADRSWVDRFAAAADAGFARVEFPWPDDPTATADAVRGAGLRVALLNMPAGDLRAGERGWPNDADRIHEWRDAFLRALELAAAVGCRTVNVLAGNDTGAVSRARQLTCLEENLRWALPVAADAGVTLVTELLNRRENPDYLLATAGDAAALLEHIGPMGWKLQLDTHHVGLTVDDVPSAIRSAAGHIGHVQVADVPGRHEPGTGSLDWPAIGAALRDAGYAGPIGLEYRPLSGAVDGRWLTG